MTNELVLVTGGSGFIALHVILKLLHKGYRVRATVRSLSRADGVRAALRAGGFETDPVPDDKLANLDFAEVDLLQDRGWNEAVAGTTAVLHVASPFPAAEPDDEDELIRPAREGTLRALRAAQRAGTVRRVVVTSSIAAIFAGHPPDRSAAFTEADWTVLENPQGHVSAYYKSKTVAERAAWDWLRSEEGRDCGFKLSTVNPAIVCGPAIIAPGSDTRTLNTSLEIPRRLLSGSIPALPDLHFSVVDVRDVADLHILAFESPRAAGQRYIAASDEPTVALRDLADALRRGLPLADSIWVPRLPVPKFMVRAVSFLDKSIKLLLPEIGLVRPVSNAKAREELGWRPRSAADAILASAKSLKACKVV